MEWELKGERDRERERKWMAKREEYYKRWGNEKWNKTFNSTKCFIEIARTKRHKHCACELCLAYSNV